MDIQTLIAGLFVALGTNCILGLICTMGLLPIVALIYFIRKGNGNKTIPGAVIYKGVPKENPATVYIPLDDVNDEKENERIYSEQVEQDINRARADKEFREELDRKYEEREQREREEAWEWAEQEKERRAEEWEQYFQAEDKKWHEENDDE